MVIKVAFDFELGIPIIPGDIKERVRSGEQIDIEILSHTSGFAKNALKWGVAGLWIDGGRVGTTREERDWQRKTARPNQETSGWGYNQGTGLRAPAGFNPHEKGRWPANLVLGIPEDEYELRDNVTPDELRELAGWLDANT